MAVSGRQRCWAAIGAGTLSALKAITAKGSAFSRREKPLRIGRKSDRNKPASPMIRTLAIVILAGVTSALQAEDQSTSPYATAADFAKYAMQLREKALLKVEPMVQIPTASHAAIARYPWKTSIVTTVFWVGEQAGAEPVIPCPIPEVPGT